MMEGKSYKSCSAEVKTDGELVTELTYSAKGYLEESRRFDDDGEVSSVQAYTYDTDGKTLILAESGPTSGDITYTSTYEWEAGDLVRVENESDDYGDSTATYTYEKGGRRAEAEYDADGTASDDDESWSWSEGDDGGEEAEVEAGRRDSDEVRTYEWDKQGWLTRVDTEAEDSETTAVYHYGDDADRLLESLEIRGEAGEFVFEFESELAYDEGGRIEEIASHSDFGGDALDSTTEYDGSCD